MGTSRQRRGREFPVGAFAQGILAVGVVVLILSVTVECNRAASADIGPPAAKPDGAEPYWIDAVRAQAPTFPGHLGTKENPVRKQLPLSDTTSSSRGPNQTRNAGWFRANGKDFLVQTRDTGSGISNPIIAIYERVHDHATIRFVWSKTLLGLYGFDSVRVEEEKLILIQSHPSKSVRESSHRETVLPLPKNL